MLQKQTSKHIIIITGLVLVTSTVYSQTLSFDFVNFDDDVHVYQNPHVLSGVTLENLVWAFGIHGPSQWHPLAWISHQLDCGLFGISAGGHHLTSLMIHALSVVLLYLTFFKLTGFPGRSFFVAAIFAIHPINVESVVWVSERRNVLCGLFWMLTIFVYSSYARRGKANLYLLVVLLMSFSLMAKPMAVTLPFVLLLLDYWPLDRAALCAKSQSGNPIGVAASVSKCPTRSVQFLVLEKIPLLLLSLVSAIFTIQCQQSIGTIASVEFIPISTRLANSLVAYGTYLSKSIWPADLAVFYPHPYIFYPTPDNSLTIPAIKFGLLLLVISGGVLYFFKRAPYLAVGWFWYLGTLIPMIGLVQVGEQQFADRYAYIPLIGILMMVSWLLGSIAQGNPVRTSLCRFALVAIILIYSVACVFQVDIWRNSVTLFRHTINVTDRNSWAHVNLGLALKNRGETAAAIHHYEEAININPNYPLAHYNLGIVWHELGRLDAAKQHFSKAIRLKKNYTDAHVRLGAVYGQQGDLNNAIRHFLLAIQDDPYHVMAHLNTAIAYQSTNNTEQAINYYQRVLELDPENAKAQHRLFLLDPNFSKKKGAQHP